jgi:hypothetical protein
MEQFGQIVAAAISVRLTHEYALSQFPGAPRALDSQRLREEIPTLFSEYWAIAISAWRHCKSAHRSLRYARPLFEWRFHSGSPVRSLRRQPSGIRK